MPDVASACSNEQQIMTSKVKMQQAIWLYRRLEQGLSDIHNLASDFVDTHANRSEVVEQCATCYEGELGCCETIDATIRRPQWWL